MENKKLEILVKALDDKKGMQIEALRVADLTIVAEYYILVTGGSNTHVRTLAEEAEFRMRQAGIEPLHIEGRSTGWILLDYGDVIVHVFSEEQRRLYGLEKLWADAQPVPLDGLLSE